MNNADDSIAPGAAKEPAPAGSMQRIVLPPDVEALAAWMKEVTAILCYQPEVPMKHKEDLCVALNEFNHVVRAQQLKRR